MHYNLPKGYLSASQIKLLFMCGLKYEYRYIKDIHVPSNYAMSIGSAAHKGFEYFYKEKIKGCITSSNDILDYALTELEKHTSVDTKEATIMGYVVPPYIDNVAQNVTPLEVEKEIKYTSKCGVELLGYIDLLTQGTICDYKITEKKWDIAKLQGYLQFIGYGLATGINKVNIHNVTKSNGLKSKTEEKPHVKDIGNIRLLDWEYTQREYTHLELIIERAARTISSGVFMPCEPTSWVCNEKWCEYWGMCRGG